MARFKRLSIQELQSLESPFIQYLVSQGIDAEQWIEIKKHDADKAEIFIDNFSDFIQLTALVKCQFISKLEENCLRTCQCQLNQFYLLELKWSSDIKIKLFDKGTLEEILQHPNTVLSRKEIPYHGNREDSIYHYLKIIGYSIDYGEWFKSIALSIK